MSLPLPLLSAVEMLINQQVTQPAQHRLLVELSAKVLAIHLRGIDTWVYVLPYADGVYLLNQYEGCCDVQISGLPLTLLRLFKTGDVALLSAEQIQLIDEQAIFPDFLLLFSRLQPDWETLLTDKLDARWAAKITAVLDDSRQWQRQQQQAMAQSCGQWLHNRHLLPSRAELIDFTAQIQKLEQDLTQLTEKFNHFNI
jgi:ubiquinone biosynthesis protein UbiJ